MDVGFIVFASAVGLAVLAIIVFNVIRKQAHSTVRSDGIPETRIKAAKKAAEEENAE
jgi:hypothetical protein